MASAQGEPLAESLSIELADPEAEPNLHGLLSGYSDLPGQAAFLADVAWLVRAYWNPLALLIFLGPAIMALGGAVSLSDRRLRLGVGRKAEATA